MNELTNNSIEVKALDPDMVSEITKTTIEAKSNGINIVGLNFQTTKGGIPEGISLLDVMHKSEVEFITNGNGELTLGAILPLAGGKFGERKADAAATFVFREDTKTEGKKRKALSASEKNSLEILDKLSGGRKARIKAFMHSGSRITAAEMVSLGLVDKTIGGFVDKYEQARKDAKEEAKKNKKK